MKRAILVIERDVQGRVMMERVLTSAGHRVEGVASAKEVERALDAGEYALAIADELGGTGAMLDEVRSLRERWPTLPVVVTGSLLSTRVLLELLRIGAAGAIAKPFVPNELRDAVERALIRATPGEDRALDWAAAIASVRDALSSGDLDGTDGRLQRAFSIAPLDPEAVALAAVLAEMRGDDRRATQLYRAAAVLDDDESGGPPDPREGIARVVAYAGATPVDVLDRGLTAWVGAPEEADAEAQVHVLTVGVSARPDAHVHLRRSPSRSFAVALGDDRPETLAAVLDRIGAGEVRGPASVDLQRIASLRGRTS